MDSTRLRQVLTQHFDEEELKTLCFDLGIDYDDLPGDGKAAKARELVGRLERRGEVGNLVTACYHRRPNAYWANEASKGGTGRLLMSQVGRLEIRMDRMEGEIDRLRIITTATLTAVLLSIGGVIFAAILT